MEVILTRNAEKQLKKAPANIVQKFLYWVSQVEDYGLLEVRKIPGFHDEPLKGQRKGQRSVRLSKSWRAIYTIEDNILVIEVHNHDY
jgi:proteic killer suppression protein